MRAWNRRVFVAAVLLGAAWLAFIIGVAGGPNGHGLVSSAHAQPAPIRRLIEWLRGTSMPDGIVKAEGRIEAAEIGVASKYAGELAGVTAQEGDKVAAGQEIARVKSPELEAELQAAQAKLESARQERAQDPIRTAQAKVDEIKARLAALTVVAPREGKVQRQLAHAGDTIAAGAAIVTLIDLSDVRMTVFVPSADAAKLGLGDQARLILDAAPDFVIPATVGFVASSKPNETKEERAKEMLRVDLAVDPKVLDTYSAKVETGLRGAGFVRTRADAKWPADLQVKLPPAPPAPAPAQVAQEAAPPSAPAASAATAEPTPAASAVASITEAAAPQPDAKAATPLVPAAASALAALSSTSPPAAQEGPPPPAAGLPPPPAPPSPPAPASPPAAQASASPGLGVEEPAGEAAPASLAQLAGAWAQSTDDCKKIFERRAGALSFRQPVDKFAQAMIIDSQRIRLPTGVCRMEGASREGNALRVNGECQDAISYTPQTTYLKLTSNNELVYNPNGDPALNTSLRRCSLYAEATPTNEPTIPSRRLRRPAP